MKIKLLSFIVVWPLLANSQDIFRTPQEFETRLASIKVEKSGNSILAVKSGGKFYGTDLSSHVKVVKRDGTITKIGKESIWGYEKNNSFYRLYGNSNSFRITDHGIIYIYERPVIYYSSKYISAGPSGTLLRFRKKNLLKIYPNRECIETALDQMKKDHIGLKRWNKQNGEYFINTYLKSHHCDQN